jgi:hypothetical protein
MYDTIKLKIDSMGFKIPTDGSIDKILSIYYKDMRQRLLGELGMNSNVFQEIGNGWRALLEVPPVPSGLEYIVEDWTAASYIMAIMESPENRSSWQSYLSNVRMGNTSRTYQAIKNIAEARDAIIRMLRSHATEIAGNRSCGYATTYKKAWGTKEHWSISNITLSPATKEFIDSNTNLHIYFTTGDIGVVIENADVANLTNHMLTFDPPIGQSAFQKGTTIRETANIQGMPIGANQIIYNFQMKFDLTCVAGWDNVMPIDSIHLLHPHA